MYCKKEPVFVECSGLHKSIDTSAINEKTGLHSTLHFSVIWFTAAGEIQTFTELHFPKQLHAN